MAAASDKTIEAIQYGQTCYEGMIAMVHGMGQKMKHIFVPSLKLTFDSKWNVWKTETLDIEASERTIWDAEALADPTLAKQIKESQEKEQKEINQIKSTIRHITITETMANNIVKLYELNEQKKVIQAKLTELGFP